MYNNRRYSLAQYSINQQTKTVGVAEPFSTTLEAVAGAAVPVSFQDRYGGTVQGSVRGTISIVSSFSGASGLLTKARMLANVLTQISCSEDLSGAAYVQKNTPTTLSALDELAASTRAGKNVPTPLKLAEHLTTRAAGSKNINGALAVSEVLTSMLEATSQITQRATFQLTIPPGEELRIDSELFTAHLNGENALHTQSGDWINVSRELLRLSVESASGGQLQGQLIYTERYL